MNLKTFLLTHETVRLGADASDWMDAVKIGTDLLEEAGCVTDQYYKSIIDGVGELGPYFLMAPGMAMPHGRPDSGVLRDGFALTVLKEPVCFGDPDNDPVDILITLAARDAEVQNEEAIVQVVTLLDSEKAVSALREAETMEDLKHIFDNLESES